MIPFEAPDMAALAPLEAELASGGARARSERVGLDRPEPAFASTLRARLLEQLPVAERTSATAERLTADAERTRLTAAAERTRPATPGPGIDPGGSPIVGSPTQSGRPLAPHVVWRPPAILPGPRWTVAIAAALVVGVLGIGPGKALLTGPAMPSAIALDVAGATIVHAGREAGLAAGTNLVAGDEIRTAADGHAVVALGAGQARLAGGADLVIDDLAADRIALDQLAGRVYHRVSLPAGGTYVVATAAVTWTARGTAFDLDRSTELDGTTHVALIAVEHSVVVAGPGVSVTVAQGRQADVVLTSGATGPDLATSTPTTDDLDIPWLADNAARDLAGGFDPGILASIASTARRIEPTASIGQPSQTPGVEPNLSPREVPAPSSPAEPSPAEQPTPSPSATPDRTADPSPRPTPAPTPRPTPKPTPTPTPTPIKSLELNATACPGGTILDWSAATSSAFHHYRTYWSSSDSFASPTLVETSATTSRTATSAADGDATGMRWYRTYAYDSAGHVVGRSPIRSVEGLGGPASLGSLATGPDGGGGTTFGWTAGDLPAACASFTKLVYAADGEPSYGQPGTELLWYTGDPSIHDVTVTGAPSGTWWFRVQMLRETALGKVVVAETGAVQYTVP